MRDKAAELEAMCLVDLRSMVRQYGLVMVAEMLTEILSQQSDMLVLANMLNDVDRMYA